MNKQFETRKLGATTEYKFMVQGNVSPMNPFPLDMLRYDCAWPAASIDAEQMAVGPEGDVKTIVVNLKSINPPTVDRWASFGFKVFTAAGIPAGV